MSDLRVIVEGGVLRVTINRPAKRNALSRDLLKELGEVFAAKITGERSTNSSPHELVDDEGGRPHGRNCSASRRVSAIYFPIRTGEVRLGEVEQAITSGSYHLVRRTPARRPAATGENVTGL